MDLGLETLALKCKVSQGLLGLKLGEAGIVSDICEGVDIERCIMVSMSQWLQMMSFFLSVFPDSKAAEAQT